MIGSGATTRSTNPSVPTVVDPEALMLVSLLHASQEPRLGDLIVNWATHNVDLLSVQRIRNLLQTYPSDVHEVLTSRLAWFAEIAVTEGADPRWRPLMKPAQERDADMMAFLRWEVLAPAVRYCHRIQPVLRTA